MIKSVGSVFENSIIADCTFGHLFNLQPFLEPAANMVYRRNIFANISTTGDPCTACRTLTQDPCDRKCKDMHTNSSATKKCKADCATACDGACNTTATAVELAHWREVYPAELDTSVNTQTRWSTLRNSSRLSGHANYAFADGPPPGQGWPPLSEWKSGRWRWRRRLRAHEWRYRRRSCRQWWR